METTRFDTLRAPGGDEHHRGALRFLAAATFGLGALAVLGGEESPARRRGGKKKSGRGKGGGVARWRKQETWVRSVVLP